MSLRLRLTLILGSAFILLWSLAAAWMLCDLRGQMMRSFDQRLAASARMVAGLLQQLPQPQPADGQTTRLSAEQLGIPNGMACQVSSLRGEVLAQSHATPERALVETQNQLFQRIAQAIERERRLTGDAAHELRSPLTAIKTHLQVARMTEGAAAEQALAHAEEGADRLHRTLDQLLLLARVEGSLSFDDGVQCSAEDAARVAMHDAGHGDVRMFELKLADGLSEAPLEVPSVLAIAALRNLLDNALRHTAAGTRVELAVETAQGCARFHVRDHGPGIAETDLPHLTRRFWRHGKSGGSGLGLAIVQAIVQRCQCRLDFDSRADGLRVTLEMPLRE